MGEEVLGAQDQEEQEVQGCLEVPECQEEDTATQDVSASICPATWEVLECPQCHRPGLDQELDLVDLVPHLFLPRVETEQEMEPPRFVKIFWTTSTKFGEPSGIRSTEPGVTTSTFPT